MASKELQLGHKNNLFPQTLPMQGEVTISPQIFLNLSCILLILLCGRTSPQALACFSFRLNRKLQNRVATKRGDSPFLLVLGVGLALEKPAVRMTACNSPQRRHFIPQPSLHEVEQSVFVWFAQTCTTIWPSAVQISIRLLFPSLRTSCSG